MVTVPDVRSFGFRVLLQPDLNFILLEPTATSAPETAQATSQGFDGNRDPEQTCGHRRRILEDCHPVMVEQRLRGAGSVNMVHGGAWWGKKTTGEGSREARGQVFMIRRSFVDRPEIIYLISRQYHFSSLFLLPGCLFSVRPGNGKAQGKGAASATATGFSCSSGAGTHGRVVLPFSRL